MYAHLPTYLETTFPGASDFQRDRSESVARSLRPGGLARREVGQWHARSSESTTRMEPETPATESGGDGPARQPCRTAQVIFIRTTASKRNSGGGHSTK